MASGVALGLVLTACPKPDERVAPLEARVAELEAQLKSVQTDLEALQQVAKAAPEAPSPPPAPTTMPLLGTISAPFEAMGFTIAELSADELAAARVPDGFALTRSSPRQRLLVLGSLVATASNATSLLGDNMNSYSVVLDARIVDEKTREVQATVRKHVQVLGISPEGAFRVQEKKFQAIQTALSEDFAARTGQKK